MKALLAASGLFVACALLVIAAPHHRRVESDFRPCTLGQIYAEIFSGALKGTDSDLPARGIVWLAFFTAVSLLATAFPVLFVGLTQWWAFADDRALIFITLGGAAVIGAAANLMAML